MADNKEKKHYQIDIYKKIRGKERERYKLYVDAIYKSDPKIKNIRSEVLSKLIGVKNQGGFRFLGSKENPKLIILWSTGTDLYWKNEMNSDIGVYLYYGDNKTPGRPLHETNLHGNEILSRIFDWATSENEEDRKKIPPIFAFEGMENYDVRFLGLAVPGIKGRKTKDWLTAVWCRYEDGERFQNYKALFTILNTPSNPREEDGISLAWLNDIEDGNTLESKYAPREWLEYINNGFYTPLIAHQEKKIKSKEEQMPQDRVKKEMLKELHDYFIAKDNGYSFEGFASDLLEDMDSSIEKIEVTRPFKDGGFDAFGDYRLFNNVEKTVKVEFYMQAKCYKDSNPIKIQDTSRLISRIKNRQFGIMVTTSYISQQAYKEILEDKHPIIIVNGRDIIDFIFDEYEIKTKTSLLSWLKKYY